MTVDEARKEKSIFEDNLRALVLDFEDKTECYIDEIHAFGHRDEEIEIITIVGI